MAMVWLSYAVAIGLLWQRYSKGSRKRIRIRSRNRTRNRKRKRTKQSFEVLFKNNVN